MSGQDSIVEWIGVHTDITEQMQAKEALAESERFARSTLDSLSAHIAILDETGLIHATNKAWRDFGVANGAMSGVGVGANYLQVCDRAKVPFALAAAAGIRAVIRGEQKEFVLEYPCHSLGEKRWFVARASRFAGEGSVRVVVAHENITAAKLADEERQKFVSLVENSSDFIGMATLSGKVLYTNPAARALVGLDPEESGTAYKITHFFTEAGTRVLNESALPALVSTGRYEGEVQYRNIRTGQPINVHASAFLVRQPESGEPLCMAVVARDITERKRQEEELRSKTAFLEVQTEFSLDGLLVVDHRLNKILQNRQFADIWQIPSTRAG